MSCASLACCDEVLEHGIGQHGVNERSAWWTMATPSACVSLMTAPSSSVSVYSSNELEPPKPPRQASSDHFGRWRPSRDRAVCGLAEAGASQGCRREGHGQRRPVAWEGHHDAGELLTAHEALDRSTQDRYAAEPLSQPAARAERCHLHVGIERGEDSHCRALPTVVGWLARAHLRRVGALGRESAAPGRCLRGWRRRIQDRGSCCFAR